MWLAITNVVALTEGFAGASSQVLLLLALLALRAEVAGPALRSRSDSSLEMLIMLVAILD